MGLFLPLLLLGLAQPVDQPTTPAPAQPESQVQGDKALWGKVPVLVPERSGPVGPNPIKVYRDNSKQQKRVCYTMRSYIFERRDNLAPELLGMTTCDPAQASSEKQVHSKARLVPAN